MVAPAIGHRVLPAMVLSTERVVMPRIARDLYDRRTVAREDRGRLALQLSGRNPVRSKSGKGEARRSKARR